MSRTDTELVDRIRTGSARLAIIGCVLLIVCTMLWNANVLAQATSGLTGVVTDATNAVIVGAKLTLTDPGTGFSKTAETNDVGVYQFSLIAPGDHYTLAVSKEGFQTVTITNLALGVGTKETRNVVLQVGSTAASIEVVAEGEVTLNTTDASIGTIVDGTRVQDLPSIFVDNAANLLRLAPGVISGANDPENSQLGATTGTRADQANITLDGLDVNDERIGQAFTTVINVPLDTIQELKTTVGGNDASYGHSAGAQVELATKYGTNQFHGQAYEFNRVTAFAANNLFNVLNKVGKPPLIRNQFGGDVGGPILRDKVFFFFAYNGLRERSSQQINDIVPLDAFRSGQLNYINNSDPVCATDPLSKPSCISTTPVLASSPNSLVSLDPSHIGANAALLSLIKSRPYPEPNNFNSGDLINSAGYGFAAPVSRRDNTFIGRIDYHVSGNHRLFARGTWDRSVDDDAVNHLVETFPGDPVTATIVDHSRSWVVGHTWTISPRATNQASFGETNSTLVFPLKSAPTFPNLLNFFFNGNVLTSPYNNDINGNASLNEQFPVVAVYQARDALTLNRGRHSLQFGGVIKPIVFKSGNLTDYNIFSVGLGGNLNALDPTVRPSDLNGSTLATSEWDTFFPLALGRFASVNAGYNYDTAGNPIPQGTVPIRDYHSTEYEFFGQDTWNIRSDLTMTYGLRWEFHNPLSEVNGFEVIPNLTPEQLLAIRQKNAAAGIEGPTAAPLLTYSLGGPANKAGGYYYPSYRDFAPRIGLAYSPSFKKGFLGHVLGDRKTSIRTGFGINYDVNLIGQGFELDETSFLFSNLVVNSFGLGGSPGAFLPGGDPRFAGLSSAALSPLVLPPGTTPRPSFTPNVDSNGVPIGFATNGGVGSGQFFNFDPNYKTPYEMGFSFGFQRELPGNWVVDVSYFGKLGRRLTAAGDAAQTLNFKDAASGHFLYSDFLNTQKELNANVPVGSLTAQPWFESQVGAAVAALFGPGNTCMSLAGTNCTNLAASLAQVAWTNGDVSTLLLNLAASHPTGNPELSLLPLNAAQLAQNGVAAFIGNFGSSTYHSLLVKVDHRLSSGLAMELTYAFAHSIDNDSDIQNSLIFSVSNGTAEVCDLRDLRVCRGNSNFDAKHTGTANFEYALPFGRGRWLGRNSSRVFDELIGGWKVSGIVIAHSGFPFKIDSATFPIDFTQSASAVFVGTQADVKGNVHTEFVNGQPTIQFFAHKDQAFGAFRFPSGGGTGNRNVVRGPGYWNVDLAAIKEFTMPWSEQHKLQLRVEGFNAFNHVNFDPPNANISSPGGFGSINQTVNSARQVQLGAKYVF
jgi:hypothetical protein